MLITSLVLCTGTIEHWMCVNDVSLNPSLLMQIILFLTFLPGRKTQRRTQLTIISGHVWLLGPMMFCHEYFNMFCKISDNYTWTHTCWNTYYTGKITWNWHVDRLLSKVVSAHAQSFIFYCHYSITHKVSIGKTVNMDFE